MVAHANNSTDQRHDLALWLGVLAGPVAWFVHLNLAYAWGWWACGGRSLLPSHLTGLLCLAVAASGGALAWREWRGGRRRAPGDRAPPRGPPPPLSAPGPPPPPRF